MKLFLLGFSLFISFQALAFDRSQLDDAAFTTAGLTDLETQTVDESTNSEIIALTDCMADSDELKISETSCINEVYGDIYN
jgi:hypothetical protein